MVGEWNEIVMMWIGGVMVVMVGFVLYGGFNCVMDFCYVW